jgi:YcaO-like protein with predicted kinase domain
VCAESIGDERVHEASYAELSRTAPGAAVDPVQLGLPFDTGYRPRTPIRWTGAYDLVADRYRWVPVDLVISPGTEGVAPGTETNGLAAGNSYTEATLHALYEVIERDAVAAEEFFHQHHDAASRLRRPVRLVHQDTLPEECALLVAGLRRAGVRLAVQDLTAGCGVPVYGVVLIDESYPGAEGVPVTFAGYGCDLDPRHAVMRALTEAAQAHTGVTLGARDDFEGLRPVPDRPAMLRRRLDLLYGEPTVRFAAADRPRTDLLSDIRAVLDRLRTAGYDTCLVSELTRADLGIPVVRVLVPGLAAPYPDSARRPVPRLLETVL